MDEIEKDAVRFARKLGHSVENLKTMRAPNTINPFAKYRIDTSKLEFIELPEPRKRMQNSEVIFTETSNQRQQQLVHYYMLSLAILE